MKHTKGPWKAQRRHGTRRIYDIGVSCYTLASARNENNANLIAAAPELLEALEAALGYIDECPVDPDIYPEQWQAWEKLQSLNAKSLIAKAKGLTQ